MDTRFSQASNAYGSTTKLQVQKDKLATPELPNTQETDFDKPDFGDLVSQSLNSAKNAGYSGEITSIKGLTNDADLHEMVSAITNAELTLQTVVAVRDKVISAYQDIIKMPI